MASLLDRMNVQPSGPIRKQKSGSQRPAPYSRTNSNSHSRPPKGNVEEQWNHDLFDSHNDLQSRIFGSSSSSSSTSKPQNALPSLAQKAVSAALGQDSNSHPRNGKQTASSNNAALSIQGAATKAFNRIRVSGLASGTTPEDVATIFRQCGPVTESVLDGSSKTDNVVVRITFKDASAATSAVDKFHGQQADGKVLSVVKVGQATARNLAGRMGGRDGLDLVRAENNLDVLMDSDEDGAGSKMRSDSLARADPRAQVMVAPPGADPTDYLKKQQGRRGRGGGRRRGGRGGNGGRDLSSRMDIS